MHYTGIGSRKTPEELRPLFSRIATRLERLGFILRSGGAEGADQAFEDGVSDPSNPAVAEIYLPRGRRQFLGKTPAAHTVASDRQWGEARQIAQSVHPIFDSLPSWMQELHTRNVFQVLGLDLDNPSKFVICWTEDGAEDEAASSKDTGGTRTAIVLAARCQIPVINFGNPGAMDRLKAVFEALQAATPADRT